MLSEISPARGGSNGAVMTIQETIVVTPLRPAKAKRADNTAALRQRRGRAERNSSAAATAAEPVQISDNSLRMASILAADRSPASPSQIEGVRGGDHLLDVARTKRDEARDQDTASRSPVRFEVTKLEAKQTQAGRRLLLRSDRNRAPAKLVARVSRGAIQPGSDHFAMLWLLFRTFLPQVGGLISRWRRGLPDAHLS
jgi:hypothetical protein